MAVSRLVEVGYKRHSFSIPWNQSPGALTYIYPCPELVSVSDTSMICSNLLSCLFLLLGLVYVNAAPTGEKLPSISEALSKSGDNTELPLPVSGSILGYQFFYKVNDDTKEHLEKNAIYIKEYTAEPAKPFNGVTFPTSQHEELPSGAKYVAVLYVDSGSAITTVPKLYIPIQHTLSADLSVGFTKPLFEKYAKAAHPDKPLIYEATVVFSCLKSQATNQAEAVMMIPPFLYPRLKLKWVFMLPDTYKKWAAAHAVKHVDWSQLSITGLPSNLVGAFKG